MAAPGVWDRQVKDYAEQLGRSKIVVCTSSKFGYALSKYPEAAQAGALVFGNIPWERQEEYASYMAAVSLDATDNDIIERVRWYQSNDAESERLAAVGQKLSLDKYCWEQYANRFVTHAHLFLKDRRQGKL